jgi:hypothetical protein
LAQPIQALAQSLTDSPVHAWALGLLRASEAVSPLAQAAHIIGFSIALGVSGMIALRILGLGLGSQSPPEMARRLYPWLAGALVVLLLTGALLFLAQPQRYLVNPVFQAKMLLLMANLTITAVLAAGLRREPYWRGVTARGLAGASALLWIATILAGRMIAYAPSAAE